MWHCENLPFDFTQVAKTKENLSYTYEILREDDYVNSKKLTVEPRYRRF
jgi:hypothetical protein